MMSHPAHDVINSDWYEEWWYWIKWWTMSSKFLIEYQAKILRIDVFLGLLLKRDANFWSAISVMEEYSCEYTE